MSAQVTATPFPGSLQQSVKTKDVEREGWGDSPNEFVSTRPAKMIGWISIGFGIAKVIWPRKVSRYTGASRARGLRDIAIGAAILNSQSPGRWMKARVASDAADLASLGKSWSSANGNKAALTVATASAAAIAATNYYYARQYRTVPDTSRVAIDAVMAVNRSPQECYEFWRKLENHPRFMPHMQSVETTGERTSHWKMKAPASKPLEWDSDLTEDTPGESLQWKSTGGDLENSGSVRFEPRRSGPGTIVRLQMEFDPPAPGASIPGLVKYFSERKVKEDLRRFKNLMEAGEIPTTQGQTSGRLGDQQ